MTKLSKFIRTILKTFLRTESVQDRKSQFTNDASFLDVYDRK